MSIIRSAVTDVDYHDIYPHFVAEHLHIPEKVTDLFTTEAIWLQLSADIELRKLRKDVEVSCRKGCSYCCALYVGTFLTERLHILTHLLLFNADKYQIFKDNLFQWGNSFRKFLNVNGIKNTDILKKLDKKGRKVANKYMRAMIPCPFLSNNECMIYATRPVVCRAYFSLSDPVLCSKPGGSILKSSYSDSLNHQATDLMLSIEARYFTETTAMPLGYYFFINLPQIEKIALAIEEYAQTVPIDERPVCTHPYFKQLPIETMKKHPRWPVYQFLDKCYQAVYAAHSSPA